MNIVLVKYQLMFLFSLVLSININAQTGFEKVSNNRSAAKVWMEAYLEAIKQDGQGPTVQSRNMYHIASAMYDAWLVYNPTKGEHIFLGKEVNGYTIDFDGFDIPENRDSAMFVTISYAAFRLMINRFSGYSSKVRVSDNLIFLMEDLGLEPYFKNDDFSSGSPAALGNYIGNQMYEFGLNEPAGDDEGYEAPNGVSPANNILKPNIPGNRGLKDKNRWQPLSVLDYVNEKGWDSTLLDWNFLLINASDVFLTPHWGMVTPFAMGNEHLKMLNREGIEFNVYLDPGGPPVIDKDLKGIDEYRWNHTLVGVWSGHNDPADETMIDISPGAIGPTTGMLPSTFEEYQSFYDFENGGTKSKPHKKNPYTGEPYAKNIVKRGDYTRIIAEYWVDAVNTYTPPGHWVRNLIDLSESKYFEKKWGGKGPILDDTEWDIKSYLTLTGALHDAGIAAWGIKAYYDYIRPISALRWMSDNGQCTDSMLPRYHPEGLPLIPGKIELVTKRDPLVGEDKENLNKIKIYSWRGPDYVNDVETDVAGAGWILAENWWPYQRYSFATPPFAGYVSGHSCFSITAAEILTKMTGSPFFPGGLKEITFKKEDSFLDFEKGPSEDITLQWATYREAADETCLSRVWGGIHPPCDDVEGRKVGAKVAEIAFKHVNKLFR